MARSRSVAGSFGHRLSEAHPSFGPGSLFSPAKIVVLRRQSAPELAEFHHPIFGKER